MRRRASLGMRWGMGQSQALENEIRNHDSLIEPVMECGQSLVKAGHFAAREISKQLWELQDAVELLKEEAEKRGSALREQHIIQLFLSERELGAINREVDRIGGEARMLGIAYPHIKGNLQERLEEVAECWDNLYRKAGECKERLLQAEQVQAYVSDCRVFLAWVNEMDTLLDSEEQARGMLGMEQLCKHHDEYKCEIDKQRPKYEELRSVGNELRKNTRVMSEEVDEKLNELSENMDELVKKWERLEELYQKELWKEAQLRELELLAAWLNSKEGLVTSNNYGDSVDEVEDLIKKQEDFEKMLAVQNEKIGQLENTVKGEGFRAEASVKERERKVARVPSLKRRGSDKKPAPLKISEKRRSDLGRSPKSWTKETIVSPAPKTPTTPDLFFSPVRRAIQRGPDTAEDRRRAFVQSPLSPNSFSLHSPEAGRPSVRALNSRAVSLPSELLARLSSSEGQDPTSLAQGGISTEAATAQSPPTSADSSQGELHPEQATAPTDGCQLDPATSPLGPTGPGNEELLSLTEAQQSPQPLNSTAALTSEKVSVGYQAMEGTLERMHKLQPGGIKVISEDWVTYFVTLKEQALCFYKNESDGLMDSPCSPTLVISDARCEEAADSTDKTHTFCLQLSDGSEYLFSAPSGSLIGEWIQKISNNADSCGGSDETSSSAVNVCPLQSPQHSCDPFTTKSQLMTGSPTKKEKPGTNKDLLPRRTPSFRVKHSNSSNLSVQRAGGQRDKWRNRDPPLGTNGTKDSGVESNSTGDTQSVSVPPPKPPHTYYNTHQYPMGGEQGYHGLNAGSRQTLGSTPDLCVERRQPGLSGNRQENENRRKTWEPESTGSTSTFTMPTWHHTRDTDMDSSKKKNVFKKFFAKK
ncbi:hypothetical protein chiPu_0019952 [Chiloscyllium punctatum]|uniref:PH domain-containing protein n=1 Tax=Chiloscyllium punctatum TaxID=137246 RepID=A0A401RTM6_CHIPU|nr:hypothetical protein [Chiloscyllium punctatum]